MKKITDAYSEQCIIQVLLTLNILISMTFSSASLLAQDDIAISEIVIQGNRLDIPFNQEARYVTVLTPKELKALPVQSIAEALQYVAGIDVRRRGANGVQADIGLRGSTFEQVLILLNGVKIIDPQTGHHLMNIAIDEDIIKRIEIIKGAGAMKYGQNAFAGAINIVTKAPSKDAIKLKLTLGSYNLKGGKFNVSKATEKANFFFSAQKIKSKGHRNYADYDQYSFFTQGDIQLSKTSSLTLQGSYVDNGFGASNFYAAPGDSLSYENVKTGFVSGIYKKKYTKGNLKVLLGHRNNSDRYVYNRTHASIYENSHRSNVTSAEIGIDYALSNHSIVALGVEGIRMDLKSERLGDRSRYVGALYADGKMTFWNDKIFINPSISFHQYSDFGFKFIYGIDGKIDILDYLSIFGSIGSAFRVPTYTELYYSDRANIGNENLHPENAISYETGLKWTHQYLHSQVSYFLRDGDDIIDWQMKDFVRDSMTVSLWQPSNISSINASGIDASINWRLGEMFMLSPLEIVRVQYTYTNAEHETINSIESRYALEHIRHQFTCLLMWNFVDIIHLNTGYKYTGRVSQDGYSTVDAGIGINLNKCSLDLQCNNVLNTSYEEYPGIPMPGRWWRIDISYSF